MPEFQSYSKNKNKQAVLEQQPPVLNVYNRTKRIEPVQSKPQRQMSRSDYRKVRKSYVIHAAIGVVVVSAAALVLSTSVLFNAKDVVIKGDSIYSDEEVMAAGDIERGANLIKFDAEKAQRDIMESLVYLDAVSVKKEFPKGITVNLTPAVRALSVVDEEGGYLEVSRSGRIINRSARRPEGMIVTGFVPNEPTVGGYLDCGDMEQTELVFLIIELLEKHELTGISRLDISDRFEVKLFKGEAKDERVEVKLGAPTQLDGKMALTAEIIAAQIAENEKGVLRISSPRKGTFKPELPDLE